MTDKLVLCSFCHKPIHIDHWGGVGKKNGIEYWFCDNICCVVEFDKFINSKNGGSSQYAIKQKEEKSI